MGLTCAFAAVTLPADAVLFDATKHEMAGNADWVIDADAWNNNMPAYPCTGNTNESNPGRYPTPAQSGITPATPNTYWTGGISSWAVELAKAGHTVESLPSGAAITFGNGSNPQDLSNYKLFIVVEPQNPFTAAEKSAILNFVSAGGGLFMVGDHETSDRDCDNWDSPNIWNDLTGATSASSAGVFGIWFRVDGLEAKGEDWFDDGVDNNVTTDLADPIIHGPFGDGSGGLGFFGATSMDINPADNATVKAHIWRTGQAHNNLRVTFATASYGAGRVAAIGDSSPADDNSGDPGDTLYAGWDLASGGVKNKEIHLNACHWLLNPTPDTTPPDITAGPAATPADCSAVVTWTTDEPSSSVVQYGPTVAYGSTASTAGNVTSHSVALSSLTPGTAYHYRAGSTDGSGNGPTWSGDQSFSTTAATAPQIIAGPAAGPITGNSATITWTTDEAATSLVEYGTSDTYGSTASVAGHTVSHSVQLTGLTPETTYHFRVLSTDACGIGPTPSDDATFATGPAAMDISGWTLRQYNSNLTYIFPSGTSIPSGGYAVVARNSARGPFETFFAGLGHPMPAGTVFLNSNASGSCANGCMPLINGGQTYELYDAFNTLVDAPSVTTADNNAYQRNIPGANVWTTVAEASANPGQGAGTPSGAGLVINEIADASDYTKEYIELYYDAGASNPVLAAPTATPSPRCSSETTRLAANPSGGTPPYTYQWSPATGLDSATIESPISSAPTTTAYSVVVTDNLSSSSAATPVTVTVSTPSTAPAAVPAVILPGGTSQLSAGATGGIGSYSYAWTPTAGLTDSSIANPIASPASTTQYSVIATDSLGCASSPLGVTVTVVPEVSGLSAPQPLQLTKETAGGLMFRFGWVGSGMKYHLYAVSSEGAMDSGAWEAKWCDLAGNPGGSWATDASSWASWSAPSAGSFPDGAYVVVAESGGVEGSYGQKAGGSERTHDADQAAPGGLCVGEAPSCSITSPSGGTTGGNVAVAYTITDADSPALTAAFAYSTNGGSTWFPATAASGSNPATVPPGAGAFSWASGTDIPASAPVLFRLSLDDGWNTSTCASAGFTIDNRPSCGITSPTGGAQSGAIVVTYNAIDLNDALLTATFEFSTTGGSSWSMASPSSGSNPASIAPGTGRTFTWASASDVPAGGPVIFRITLFDGTSASVCTTSFTVSGGSSCVGHIVISQAYGGGGFSGASYRNDYIELYNCSASSFTLPANWSVQYAAYNGTTWSVTVLNSGTVIPAHGYFLIKEGSDGVNGTLLPTADVTGTLNLSATRGKVALVNAQTALSGACPSGAAIVDFVGYGSTANCYEGAAAAPAGSNTASVLRNNGGCTDTDQNNSDFSAGTPNPRNSSSSYTCP